MALEKGSMREAIDSVYQILINDEELLRLLWYLPKRTTGTDPLSSTLPNVKSMSNYWDIIDQRIMLVEKVNDLEESPLCRLYISTGRRRAIYTNYLLATQEITITIYTHEDYEVDMRSVWISDRINELLTLENLDGMIGHLDYVAGNARVAPIQYRRYDHIYEYTSSKK